MSNIEWTDKTWNPVTGCTKVSPGCKNCYAEGIADRFFAKQYPPNADGSERRFTDVRCHPGRLEEPLHWKKPCRVFVNSMSDLFHEDVPADFIDQVFATMTFSPEHTFQILTKRPDRMLELAPWLWEKCTGGKPLPNVWLGVSVEDKKRKDRIDILRQVPAEVRFLSIEPQLEDIGDLQLGDAACGHPSLDGIDQNHGAGKVWECNLCDGLFYWEELRPGFGRHVPTINWVICGGESGPGARPFNLAWAESLLKQCQTAGVPFFMKQVGSNPRAYSDVMKAEVSWQACTDRKGGTPEEWPPILRVREFPSPQMELAK